MTTALAGGFFLDDLELNRVFEPYCTPGICRSTKKEKVNRIKFVHTSPKNGEKNERNSKG